ncbi:hypothetical protein Micbo1qcDRAFT_200342 [Microdochium bolleyi]|uniref:Uncharacterized protein n=1 Tax=Microdochium bolleyi TaxID=196109 RepID=A0A136JKK9_9PEZI|nr:hypothetical protein Micbo1qcDRAFT_200342 [Microdochium bolleyi]
MTISPGSTYLAGSSQPGHVTEKGASSPGATHAASALDLGILSALLAVLALALARIAHILLGDYMATRHLQPRSGPGDAPSHRQLVHIRREEEDCRHDTTAQRFLPGRIPDSSPPYADLMASAELLAANAIDFVVETARRGVEVAHEIRQNAADLVQAWSGDILKVQDEEAAYHSSEDSNGSTETEDLCRHRVVRPRRSSSCGPA